MTELTPITPPESERLAELETVIQRGLSNFIEVGNALTEIRDSRLYKSEYRTFETYCLDKWQFSRFQAYNLIKSSGAAKNVDNCQQSPANESQARPLTQLDTPEEQREAWTAAVEASGGKPTAKHVEAAVDEIQQRVADKDQEKREPKYQPSNGLMHADNAISQLAKIQDNDTQRSRAFAKVAKYIAENK